LQLNQGPILQDITSYNLKEGEKGRGKEGGREGRKEGGREGEREGGKDIPIRDDWRSSNEGLSTRFLHFLC